MFIVWKKTPLSDRAYSDPYCVHTGPGRVTLTPCVKESYRENGEPRNRTLWRPSRGIRTCCIADSNDPTARIAWWQGFEQDFLRVIAHLDKADGERLLDHYEWIRDEFAKIIPRPLSADETLWWCMMSQSQTPRPGESHQQRRTRLLDEARRSLEEKMRSWWEKELHYWREKAEAARGTPPRDHHRATAGGDGPGPGPRKAADTTPWFLRQLGLTWPCTEQDVKAAWRRGAKIHHPDQGGSSERFIAFKSAYDTAMEFLQKRAAA